MSLRSRLKESILISDGAMGTFLDKSLTASSLWSAECVASHPGALEEVHTKYFKAGAMIATTATYQASTKGYIEAGICENEVEAKELFKRAAQIASNAKLSDDQLVGGSIGPYGAYMADGQEYTGQYGDVTLEDLREFHKDRIAALEGVCDFLAVETIPNILELEVLVELIQKECWIAFSMKDQDHLADGTPISRALQLIQQSEFVAAVGVNCCPLHDATMFLRSLKRYTNLPLVVYPNSGELWSESEHAYTEAPTDSTLASEAKAWIEQGARIIGGCCQTTPRDIENLSNAVKDL